MRILVTGADGFVGRHLVRLLASQQEHLVFAAGGPRRRAGPGTGEGADGTGDGDAAHGGAGGSGTSGEGGRDGPKAGGAGRVGGAGADGTGYDVAGEDMTWPGGGSVARVERLALDLQDAASVRAVVEATQPHRVYHLAAAAATFGVDIGYYMEVNAVGAHRVGQAVLDLCGDSCRMLYVSSANVYDASLAYGRMDERTPLGPRNEYGVSKLAGEFLLRTLESRGLDVRIARPFNHTGPGQGPGFLCPDVALRLREALAEAGRGAGGRREVRIAAGRMDSVRDFCDVRDVVAAYVAMMERCPSGEILNVCSGEGVRAGDIMQELALAAGVERLIVEEDARQAGRAEHDVIVGSAQRLFDLTGWEPRIPLRQTLQDLWDALA